MKVSLLANNRKHGTKPNAKITKPTVVPVRILPTTLHIVVKIPLTQMIGLTSSTKDALLRTLVAKPFGEASKDFRALLVMREKLSGAWTPLYLHNFDAKDLACNNFKILACHRTEVDNISPKIRKALYTQQVRMKQDRRVRYPCPY